MTTSDEYVEQIKKRREKLFTKNDYSFPLQTSEEKIDILRKTYPPRYGPSMERCEKYVDWLKDVSYKPGWKFKIQDPFDSLSKIYGYDQHLFLEIMILGATDSTGRKSFEDVVSRNIIPEMIDTKKEFYQWISNYPVRYLEEHERKEFFKINGICLDDPHSPEKSWVDKPRKLDEQMSPEIMGYIKSFKDTPIDPGVLESLKIPPK